ncbi:hypothetical protein BVC80_695g8 [Macleaya cordata]|uniref:Serine aminopeptidase S33 domain-containing protein n=1 Tax=Macleaya cordata TaxID=56857 RepID=A0A200Q0L7_MACCD|nr:hypothetical protein BVC80_695g8 [Macleaya cordata]
MSQSYSAQEVREPVIERVIVENSYGEKLVGLLHETGSTEIVILCHGFRRTKDNDYIVNMTNGLAKQGISAFRFDFAGNGESEGSFEYGNFAKEVEDLRAVVLYFLGLKRVIGGILGHSKGGNVVLLYASKYKDVPIVVNCCGRYYMDRGIEGRLGKDFVNRIKETGFLDVKDEEGNVLYRVPEESLMERLAVDMHTACLSIDKNCRVLTVHGTVDERIPVEDGYEMAKLIPNHKLHVIEGADHYYTQHQSELVKAVVDFMKKSLELNKSMLH